MRRSGLYGSLRCCSARRAWSWRRGSGHDEALPPDSPQPCWPALAYPLVHYGSEARGYGGLILAYLVAVDAFFEMEAPSRRHRLVLGTAIGVGALFHLTMLAGAAALGLAAVSIFLRAKTAPAHRRILRAIDRALTMFRPALIALMPALIAVAAGLVLHGRFEVGGITPFTPDRFALGFGGMAGMMLGLPQSLPAWLVCVVVVIGVGMACVSGALDRTRSGRSMPPRSWRCQQPSFSHACPTPNSRAIFSCRASR